MPGDRPAHRWLRGNTYTPTPDDISAFTPYVQELAKQAQSPELPAWWENIADWIEGIRCHYPEDLARLKQWLAQ